MTQEDLCFASAVEIATLVREKKLSPVEVTDAFLVRIERLNPEKRRSRGHSEGQR
jgi:Asp-tRNA(Asn)/Glu-tRNA(Gln) amidotransferase A subunit family amidase